MEGEVTLPIRWHIKKKLIQEYVCFRVKSGHEV